MLHRVKEGGRTGLKDFARDLNPPPKAPAPVTSTDPERITPADIFRRRTVRRPELRKLVPLSDTTIYELEQKGIPTALLSDPPLRRLAPRRSSRVDRRATA